MRKENLITLFKISNILAGIAIFTVAIIMYLNTDVKLYQGLYGGMSVGIWIGVAINHFIQIPKLYENKDERQLIIRIISVGSSGTFLSLSLFILFTMVALTDFTVSIIAYNLLVLGLVAVALAVRFISYKVLDYVL